MWYDIVIGPKKHYAIQMMKTRGLDKEQIHFSSQNKKQKKIVGEWNNNETYDQIYLNCRVAFECLQRRNRILFGANSRGFS